VDSRLLLSPALSHQELHQVVASWGCEGGCRRFCHFEGGPLQQPARRRACVPSGRPPVCAKCCSEAHLQQEQIMTTSRLFFVMYSTGCQSHSASSTSSVYYSLSITTRSCSRVFARLLHCNSFLCVRATTAITWAD